MSFLNSLFLIWLLPFTLSLPFWVFLSSFMRGRGTLPSSPPGTSVVNDKISSWSSSFLYYTQSQKQKQNKNKQTDKKKETEKYFAFHFHNAQRKIINIQLHSRVWTKLYRLKNAKMKMNETLSCLAIKQKINICLKWLPLLSTFYMK